MSSLRAQPRRRLRHEIISLVLLLVIPVSILLAFPYEAIGFRAAPPRGARSPSCAFISLTADQERAALKVARSAWQVDAKGVKGLRLELSSGDLPSTPIARVLPVRAPQEAIRRTVGFAPNLLPPSTGAAAPVKLMSDKELPRGPVFPRAELLEID